MVAAFIGLAAEAKPVLSENAGASALNNPPAFFALIQGRTLLSRGVLTHPSCDGPLYSLVGVQSDYQTRYNKVNKARGMIVYQTVLMQNNAYRANARVLHVCGTG